MTGRAIEDQRAHLGTATKRSLLSRVKDVDGSAPLPLNTLLRESLADLGVDATSPLVEGAIAALPDLGSLPGDVAREFVGDFYGNRFAPYPYDFSLISKQGLSRIYERYVSILRDMTKPPSGSFFRGCRKSIRARRAPVDIITSAPDFDRLRCALAR
jgi:hypothetical protein